MRVILRTTSDDTFSTLLRKIKGCGLEVCKENKKWNFIVVNIPKAQTNVMYELLEIGGTIERDVKNDLD
jgi:hypothetical protein